MKKGMLIADSGGTKTDWCYVNTDGAKDYFSTSSYHPKAIDEQFFQEQKEYWMNKSLFNCELCFFGTGCLNVENQLLMEAFFKQLGFKDISIQSDIIAAGLGLNGGNGWGAIAGTGSVTFHMQQEKIIEIRGGLGREFGDEGSGFYFGKLVVEAFYKDELSEDVCECLKQVELIPVNFSNFPFLLKDFKNEASILPIHNRNIRALRDAHLWNIDSISFVGSYAFHHQEIFGEVLSEREIVIQSFLEKPIQSLVDFIVRSR